MTAPQKTQRQIVLEMLEEARERGLHSFEFIQARIPRVAARVCELRAEGHNIESTREALHGAAEGVRYILNAGVESEGSTQQPGLNDVAGVRSSEAKTFTLDSGVEDPAHPPLAATAAPPANPYEFEVWAA